MNYEDKLIGKMSKHEKALDALHLDMWIIYNREEHQIFGQALSVCPASDSNLIGLECWCAECKELGKTVRKFAQHIKTRKEQN